MWKLVFVILALLSFSVFSTNVLAVPFTSTFVLNDVYEYDQNDFPGLSGGSRMLIVASPYASSENTVTVSFESGGDDVTLKYAVTAWDYWLAIDTIPTTRNWAQPLTFHSGSDTALLDLTGCTFRALGIPQNVVFNGNTISWDPVPNATNYRLRWFALDGSGAPIVNSGFLAETGYLNTPSYMMSNPVPGEYALRIEAIEFCEDNPVNRSQLYIRQTVGALVGDVSRLHDQFVRDKGATTFYSRYFTAVEGEGKLILKNGPDGAGRVSSAQIILNGVVYVDNKDLNQNISDLEINVNLEKNNLLFVYLNGAPGSSLDIDIAQDKPTSEGYTGLKGTFNNAYAFYKPRWYEFLLPKQAIASYGLVEKAIAIPIVNGTSYLGGAQEIEIQDDGSFDINLVKVTSQGSEIYWMILLEYTDGRINFLNIPSSDSDESLLSLPLANSTSDLELGLITEEGVSQIYYNDITEIVSLNLSDLTQIANIDDVLKSVINDYRNNYGKGVDEHIKESIYVTIMGEYDDIGASYTMATDFKGYMFQIKAGSATALSQYFDDIRENIYTLYLVPPEGCGIETLSSSNITSCNTQVDGSTECGGGDVYIKKWLNGTVAVDIPAGQFLTVKPIPSGDFEFKLEGEGKESIELGAFDYSYSLPLTSDQQHLKIPIPSVKLDFNADNSVKGVNIKWYLYNESEKDYIEVEKSAFESISGYPNIIIDDFDGIDSNTNRLVIGRLTNENFDYVDLSSIQPPIYYNYTGEDKYNIDSIAIIVKVGNSFFGYNYHMFR